MIRAVLLFLALARVGLSDWFGSPWRAVWQIFAPVLFVGSLWVIVRAESVEQGQARVAIVEGPAAVKELRPLFVTTAHVRGRLTDEDDAQRLFERSLADAILSPGKGGSDPLATYELKVRDVGYFYWPVLAQALQRRAAGGEPPPILLDPIRKESRTTSPVPIAGFLTVLLALSMSAAMYQLQLDRLAGWAGFLRLTPVGPGFALSALALGRTVVTAAGLAYTVWLVHALVGFPAEMDWLRMAVTLGGATLLFVLLGVVLGMALPAYRGTAEVATQVLLPMLTIPSTVFWNAHASPILAPLVWVNPVTAANDALRLALGGRPTLWAAELVWLPLALWACVGVGVLVAVAKRSRRREAEA